MSNLLKLSAQQLKQLSDKAASLAAALMQNEPKDELCIEAGIMDCSYDTQSCGYVRSFRGSVTVTMQDGSTWRCVGRQPTGTGSYVETQGFIEKTIIKQ